MEGRGISHGEVYTGMGKYEKVMFLNFSEARADRGCGGNWWMTPSGLIVIEELQRSPLPTDWLSTCFSLNPPFWIETL